jgi:hypothetical protein
MLAVETAPGRPIRAAKLGFACRLRGLRRDPQPAQAGFAVAPQATSQARIHSPAERAPRFGGAPLAD